MLQPYGIPFRSSVNDRRLTSRPAGCWQTETSFCRRRPPKPTLTGLHILFALLYSGYSRIRKLKSRTGEQKYIAQLTCIGVQLKSIILKSPNNEPRTHRLTLAPPIPPSLVLMRDLAAIRFFFTSWPQHRTNIKEGVGGGRVGRWARPLPM